MEVYVKARWEGKGDSTIASCLFLFFAEQNLLPSDWDLPPWPWLPLLIHLFCESIKSIKGFYVEQTQTRRPMATLPCSNRCGDIPEQQSNIFCNNNCYFWTTHPTLHPTEWEQPLEVLGLIWMWSGLGHPRYCRLVFLGNDLSIGSFWAFLPLICIFSHWSVGNIVNV